MSFYLMDFENVKSDGFYGIEKLTKHDTVAIFYSENTDRLSIDVHRKIMSSKAEFQYFPVSVGGKNALDFQLSSYLGYIAAENKNENIYIVSRDNGFKFIINFWKELNDDINISLCTAISKENNRVTAAVVTENENTTAKNNSFVIPSDECKDKKNTEFEEQLTLMMPNLIKKPWFPNITACITDGKTLREIHNSIQKTVPKECVKEVYRNVKALMKSPGKAGSK